MPAVFDISAGQGVRIFRGLTSANLVPTGVGVSLLLHADGAEDSTVFTDSSLNNLSITAAGNARIKTDTKKFGIGSAYFDGNGDYLMCQGTESLLGNGNFTFEFWVWFSNKTFQSITNTSPHHSFGISFNRYNDNKICLFIGDGSFWLRGLIAENALPNDVWHHVAVVADNGTMRLYQNGISQTLSPAPEIGGANNVTPTGSGSQLFIGSSSFEGEYLQGYLDDLRITKGIASYTANFTPPTSAFPNP